MNFNDKVPPVSPAKVLPFDAGVGEFLAYFDDIFDEFLEGLIAVFMLGLFAYFFSIGINYKVQNTHPRGHMMFSDFYSDLIDFHGFFSKRNSY